MADLRVLYDLLRSARRRAVAAVLLQQGSIATGAALAGLILLLVLGTQILAWHWLLIVFAGGLGFGLYRMRCRIPSQYRVAQDADRRLKLDDYLSTAYYFANAKPERRGSSEMRAIVTERAAELCSTLVAKDAAPIRRPGSTYVTLALALAALGMFGVRYGVRRSLDLRPPLIPAMLDPFPGLWQQISKLMPRAETVRNDPLAQTISAPGGENSTALQRDSGQPGADSSLFDEMRQAFADIFEKVGAQVRTADGGQQMRKTGDKQNLPGTELDDIPYDRDPEPGAQSPTQEGDAEGPAGEEVQAMTGKGSDRESPRDSANRETSGIGKSAGNKDIRDAEQLAAMGKLSELFGKRRADLEGQVMVEARSSEQQGLKTPYSERGASHVEGGGEVHRDEIPLLYQPYVQRYFEQVRNTAPAAGK